MSRLLFWSSACFIGLALNNVLLFVDVILLPEVNLRTLRHLIALVALSTMLFGLISDRED